MQKYVEVQRSNWEGLLIRVCDQCVKKDRYDVLIRKAVEYLYRFYEVSKWKKDIDVGRMKYKEGTRNLGMELILGSKKRKKVEKSEVGN